MAATLFAVHPIHTEAVSTILNLLGVIQIIRDILRVKELRGRQRVTYNFSLLMLLEVKSFVPQLDLAFRDTLFQIGFIVKGKLGS